MSKNLQNSLIVLGGQLTVAITGLMMVRVLTEYLTPAEYGYLTLGITFSLMANQVIFGPLGAGLTRFFSAATELEETKAYLQSATTLTRYASVLLLGLTTIAGLVLLWLGFYRWAALLGLGMLFSIVSGMYALANGIFLAKNAQLQLTIYQSAEPLLRFMFVVMLLVALGSTAVIALSGYIAGTLIILIFQLVKMSKNNHGSGAISPENKAKWQKSILNYGFPYALWGVFTTLHLASDRWVLNWAHGQEQVGLYAALYQIGYLPIIMMVSVLAQLITPHLYKTAGCGNDSDRLKRVYYITNKAVFVCIVATLVLVTAGHFLHEYAYGLFVSKKYASVSQYLPLLILAAGLFASGQIATLHIQSAKSVSELVPIKIGCAIIGILLNYILGVAYGVMGIVLAQVFFSLTYLIWISVLGYTRWK